MWELKNASYPKARWMPMVSLAFLGWDQETLKWQSLLMQKRWTPPPPRLGNSTA